MPDRVKSDADPHNLDRFCTAQADGYAAALSEIQAGHKRSHWMWHIFPQFAGLGFSPTSQHYAIKCKAEARAYLAHPILGPRLIECGEATLAVVGRSVHDIFGSPDDLKLRSSATLFATVSPAGSVFHQLLDKYFDGQPDDATVRLMAAVA